MGKRGGNRAGVSASFLLGLLFLAGALQYASVAFSSGGANVAYWRFDSRALDESGSLRYVKDLALVAFGIYWPIQLLARSDARAARGFLPWYVFWMLLVLVVGTIPYVVGTGFLPFLTAGLRWLLLLHVSVGIGLMSLIHKSSAQGQRFTSLLLIFLCLFDLIPLSSQAAGAGLSNVTVLRLPGMFSNAGTAGYFAVSVAIIAFSAKQSGNTLRVLLMLCSLGVAVASGTRFAIISNLALAAALYLETERSLLRPSLRMYFGVGVVLPLLLVAAVSLISFTGRGDLFEQQLSEGGRISNLQLIVDEIGRGDSIDLLFGRGIGIGTNTAQGLADAMKINPLSVKWNLLIDNTIVTTFLQFGLLGSAIFWIGIVAMLKPLLRREAIVVVGVLVLGLVTQNMFEQYFLMLAFAFGLAAARREASSAGGIRGYASGVLTRPKQRIHPGSIGGDYSEEHS